MNQECRLTDRLPDLLEGKPSAEKHLRRNVEAARQATQSFRLSAVADKLQFDLHTASVKLACGPDEDVKAL